MSVSQEQRKIEPISRSNAEHDLSWAGASYTRVPPGDYNVVGRTSQGPEWLRQYRRWSLRIEFVLLDDGQPVSRFFNMGSDPERPQIGRHSLYFKWWTAANGEPPRRGQAMTPATFSEGQIYLVRVEDAIVDGHQKAKHDGEAYSRVTELLEVSRPQSSNHSISQSLNHESSNHSIRNQVINESPNQAINQSSRPPGDVSPLKDQSFASAGRGNANPKQTPRAGASVPAQASSQATTDVCEIVEELLRTAPMAEEQPQKQKRARSQAKKSYSVANYH